MNIMAWIKALPGRTGEWARRNPWQAACIGLGVLLVLSWWL